MCMEFLHFLPSAHLHVVDLGVFAAYPGPSMSPIPHFIVHVSFSWICLKSFMKNSCKTKENQGSNILFAGYMVILLVVHEVSHLRVTDLVSVLVWIISYPSFCLFEYLLE